MTQEVTNVYEGQLFLTSTIATLGELEYDKFVHTIDDLALLNDIRESIIAQGYKPVPKIVSRAVRVPVANFTYNDLYVCFDPTNYTHSDARYHLVRPVRYNIKLVIGGKVFTPTMSNFTFSEQFKVNKQQLA